MRRYTLRQLDTFLEVARAESVSRAAEKLHVTQPAVSTQLRQLEEALGIALVEANGRQIRLTEAGREVEQYAIAATSQLSQLDDAVEGLKGLQRGRISLGMVGTAKYFVPMLLVHFRRRFPAIEMSLQIQNRDQIFNMLERNELDLAVTGRVPDRFDCVSEPFATNPMGFVSAPEHSLSRRRQAPLSIFNDVDFVARENGSGTRATMEAIFNEHGIAPNIVMEMPSNESIKQAVMAGMGITFLSLRTVRHELAAGHLALLDIQGMPIVKQWRIAHLRTKKLAPAAIGLKEFLITDGPALINVWA